MNSTRNAPVRAILWDLDDAIHLSFGLGFDLNRAPVGLHWAPLEALTLGIVNGLTRAQFIAELDLARDRDEAVAASRNLACDLDGALAAAHSLARNLAPDPRNLRKATAYIAQARSGAHPGCVPGCAPGFAYALAQILTRTRVESVELLKTLEEGSTVSKEVTRVPTAWCAKWLVGLAVWVVPPGNRLRYREEWRGELWDLGSGPRRRIRQTVCALRILMRVWGVRVAVREGQRRPAGGG